MTTRTDPGAGSTTADATGRSTAPDVAVPVARHARRAWLLLALGAFQVWLWATRVINLVNDPEPRTTGFVVVHAVLYVTAFGAAGVLLVLGWRLRREAREAARRALADDTAPPPSRRP